MINDPKDTSLTVDCSRQGWEEHIHIQSAPKKKGQTAELAQVHLTLSSYFFQAWPWACSLSRTCEKRRPGEGTHSRPRGDFDAQASWGSVDLVVWKQASGWGVCPLWLSGKESVCQCRRCRFNLWVSTIPWRRKWQHTPVFLPGKSHGQRSPGLHPMGWQKSQTQLGD